MNTRIKGVGVVLAVLLLAPMVRAAEKVSVEEYLLRKAGIGTDSAKLLAFVRLRSEAGEDLRNLDALIRRLGHEDFAEREKASARLIVLDRAALPALRRVIADKDAEVARRARVCIATIERGSMPGLPLAVVRMLLQKRPPGTVAALVGYLPFEPDEEVVEVIYFGLEKLVQGKALDASLLAALRDKLPQRRALAACLVGRWGTEGERKHVRKLLEDGDAEVRLRAAQGPLGANDTVGLPTLVALLDTPSLPLAWQAEELLHYAAGEQKPTAVLGRGNAAERKACRVAWESWLRTQASKVDLQGLQKAIQRPGLVLVIEGQEAWNARWHEQVPNAYWREHLWLCGCEGQPRCKAYTYDEFKTAHLPRRSLRRIAASERDCALTIKVGLIPYADEAWGGSAIRYGKPARLENGNRIEIIQHKEYGSLHRIVEIDEKSRVVWESAYIEPVCALVLLPLVRVGFGRPSEDDMNLDTQTARLFSLKHHPQAVVRRLAAERLRTFACDTAICRGMVEALNDTDYSVHEHVLGFMKKAPPKEIYRSIPKLISFLGDQRSRRRSLDAASVLYRCGEKAVPALVAAFENNNDPNSKERKSEAIMILTWLADLPDPLLHRTLRKAFEDMDSTVRETALSVLTGPKTKARRNYIPHVVRRLQDSNSTVVKSAVRWLGEWGEDAQAAVPDFIKLLNKPELQSDVIYALASVGHEDPTVLPIILKQIKPGQQKKTYCRIANALEKYAGSKEAAVIVPVLIKMLKDQCR